MAKYRLWPKADIQYLIVEAIPVSAFERLLSTQSGRSDSTLFFKVRVIDPSTQ
jgi:hypothetical protein